MPTISFVFIYIFTCLLNNCLIIWFFNRKSVELAIDDTKQLNLTLMTLMNYPKGLLPKSIVQNLVTKVSKYKNNCMDPILGLYYLKHEKV